MTKGRESAKLFAKNVLKGPTGGAGRAGPRLGGRVVMSRRAGRRARGGARPPRPCCCMVLRVTVAPHRTWRV